MDELEARWNTEPYESFHRMLKERKNQPRRYYIKAYQIDNIREVIDNLIEVLKSFHQQLDILEQQQEL